MISTFIGGGNMGEAMLSGVLTRGVAKPQDITVSEPVEIRRNELSKKYGVKTQTDNIKAIADANVIVLAVKPQILPQVMPEFSGRIDPGQLVLSIIAGATIQTLREGLKHGAIVRSMPNTPAQIGEGVTVWTATRKRLPLRKSRQVLSSALWGKNTM